MKNIVSLAIFLAAPFGIQAQMSVKDFVLGEEIDAAAGKHNLRCEVRKGASTKLCFATPRDLEKEALRTVAGVGVTSLILAGTDEGKLGMVRYAFKQGDFLIVKAAFAEKYPKLSCVDSVVSNRMGAKFDQTECTYSDRDGVLTIERRGRDINEGALTLESSAYRTSLLREFEKKKGEAKKDI